MHELTFGNVACTWSDKSGFVTTLGSFYLLLVLGITHHALAKGHAHSQAHTVLCTGSVSRLNRAYGSQSEQPCGLHMVKRAALVLPPE